MTDFLSPPRRNLPVPGTTGVPLDYALAAGITFMQGTTRITLERVDADGGVDLRSGTTNALLSVRNPDGTTKRPDVEWIRESYAAGQLHVVGALPEDVSARQARFLLLDASAADARDKKSRWRFSLAWRAITDEIVNIDQACENWLDANYGRIPADLLFRRPSGGALRRWMRQMRKGGRRIGALVSQSGRPRNHSQLDPEIDAAVTVAALHFYGGGAGVRQVQAESYLKELVDQINDALPPGTAPHKMPSRQTLRLRIQKLECRETWAAKYGEEAAARKYDGAGEPLLVDHVLELCLMDATQLEQIVVFDDDWQIPVMKMRIVALMCVVSHAIFGWNVFPGPVRSEATAQAFLHCLEPDKFPARMIALHPKLKLVFGRPAGVMPDNEKALIGPETVAGYNEAGTTVIPAPVGMPTAKAALERFFRTIKETLAQLPGTLVDPRRAIELGFEAVEMRAELTMHQLRTMVSQAVAQHNVSPSKGLGGLSPVEVLATRGATRATAAFEDPGPVRAALCRTFPVHVTRNGVEKDGIRYRSAMAIDRLFDNNAGRLGAAGKNGTGMRMRGRRNDGDIDVLEVLDEHDGAWVALPSTQPGYTKGLSSWEHEQYAAAARHRRESFGSERARLESKAETRRLAEEMLPKAKFRRRAAMASLALSQQVAVLNGKPVVLPDDVEVAAQVVIETRTDDPTRGDDPADRTPDAKSSAKQDPRKRPDGRSGAEHDDADAWDAADFGDEDGETGE